MRAYPAGYWGEARAGRGRAFIIPLAFDSADRIITMRLIVNGQPLTWAGCLVDQNTTEPTPARPFFGHLDPVLFVFAGNWRQASDYHCRIEAILARRTGWQTLTEFDIHTAWLPFRRLRRMLGLD